METDIYFSTEYHPLHALLADKNRRKDKKAGRMKFISKILLKLTTDIGCIFKNSYFWLLF